MDQSRPIIVKKKSGGGGGDAHHGGAWKVAYADFVTAMMAFFLLMWLLNATSEEQRKGLADYFDPSIPISRNSAGGAGVLGGDNILVPPDASGTRKEGERAHPTHGEPGVDLGELEHSPPGAEREAVAATGPSATPPDTPETGAGAPSAEGESTAPAEGGEGDAALSELGDDLAATLAAVGDDGLMQHFSMRVTPEGLVIEIGDLLGEPLFTSGASTPKPVLRQLVDILVPVLQRTSNDIAVVGHTDAAPFNGAGGRTNWELSAERANAARRILAGAGLAPERVVRVSGRAATDPISPDPLAPRNRRIAITLLRRPGG